jgi:hypothetical protein
MTDDPLTFGNLFGIDPDYENAPSDYEQGQRDMLAKCIAEVERIHSPIRIDDDLSYCRKCADAAYGEYSYAWPCAVVTSVRALQQPSGPIEDLTDEEADAYYEALQEKP